jgi:hypothetical protein
MANRIITATTCYDNVSTEYIIDDSGIDFSKVYQLTNGLCSTISSGETTTNNINMSFPYGPFEDCGECNTPLSANTEVDLCVIDCSGNTVTVFPPHPVYTNGQFKDIVQLNAIVIGGNGLNS